MGEQVVSFCSPQFGGLRSTNLNGEPWFVAKDVAGILGYTNPSKAIRDHVDDEDKTTITIRSGGSNYQTQAIIINESGLYALILSSKMPKAREFKHWVTSEVLPQIRQTGGYIPMRVGETEEEVMARAILIAQNTIDRQKAIIEAQKPLVNFAEAIVASEADILVRDLAKLLTQNGITIGQNRLFSWLRKNGYIFQNDTRPYQKWVEQGLFSTSVTLIETHHGPEERCTTKVTGRGQEYFINGFTSGRFTI